MKESEGEKHISERLAQNGVATHNFGEVTR